MYGVQILILAVKVRNAKRQSNGSNIGVFRKQMQTRITRVYLVVVGVYLSTLLLGFLLASVFIKYPELESPPGIFAFLVLMNSTANFFVYVALLDDFRAGVPGANCLQKPCTKCCQSNYSCSFATSAGPDAVSQEK